MLDHLGRVLPRRRAGARATGKQRDLLADGLKGFAILLVVLGHTIQGPYRYDLADNPVFQLIYSFHMPLFMFMAGYVVALSKRTFDLRYVRRRSIQLVLPFFAWYATSYLVSRHYKDYSFVQYCDRLLWAPDHGLWFLWVLFLVSCLLVLTLGLERYIGTAAPILALIVSQQLTTPLAGLSMVRWYFPFFLAGYVLKKHPPGWSWLWLAPLAVAFFPLALSWHRRSQPAIVNRFAESLSDHHLGTLANHVPDLYQYLVAFCGIGFAFLLFQLVKQYGPALASFAWIGERSLMIYCIQFFFDRYGFGGFGGGAVLVLSRTVFAVAASLALGTLLQQFWVTNLVLLGSVPERRERAVAVELASP